MAIRPRNMTEEEIKREHARLDRIEGWLAWWRRVAAPLVAVVFVVRYGAGELGGRAWVIPAMIVSGVMTLVVGGVVERRRGPVSVDSLSQGGRTEDLIARGR
jgi:hypothetical protein